MLMYYSNVHAYKWTPEEIGRKISVLVSFYKEVHGKSWFRQEFVNNMMLDSGAFSALKQNDPINLDSLIQYCLAHKDTYQAIISLDVIGDPVKSLENYKIMKKAGVDCIPVFHIYSDLKYLYELADITDYIGIGGIAAKAKNERVDFLNKIFSQFNDSEKVGFHGFGLGSEDLISQYPWRTCDSTAVFRVCVFGGIITPWGRFLINPQLSPQAQRWKSDIKEGNVKKYVAEVGGDYERAQRQDVTGTKERVKISLAYMEQLSAEVPTKYKSAISYFGF